MKWRIYFAFIIVGIALAFFPNLQDTLGFKTSLLTYLYFVFFWASLATSWNILTGYSGYFSFGHGAFYGVGVYTTATIFTKTGMPFLLTIPFAGILSALLGLLVGLVVFRMRRLQGELFALLTLAVDFVIASIIRNTAWIDGGYGISVRNVDYPEFLGTFPEMRYRVGLLIVFLTVFTAYLVFSSRLGRGLAAIHDDEAVAEGLGVPTFRFKMIAFGLSAFFAGLIGGLHTIQISYVEVDGVFRLTVPLFVILMSLLGGRRHWLGPAIGALFIHTLNDAYSDTDLQLLNDVMIGGLLIVVILFVPEGIYERLRKRYLPALILAIIVGFIQAQFIGGRLTVQLSAVMVIVIAMLMIPERFYQRFIGQHFSMWMPPTVNPTITETASGE